MDQGTRAGLRLQIVLSLAALMIFAFVPLYFAVASLARATLLGVRDQTARALGRAVATHVAAVPRGDQDALAATLKAHLIGGDVEALCVYGPTGEADLCAGDLGQAALRPPLEPPYREALVQVHGGRHGRAADVVVPLEEGALVARVRTGEDGARFAPLSTLVGLYMATFGLAMVVFAYFALTRLLVRPIEALSQAADRVARGSRTIVMPRQGPREIGELASSLQAMTDKLLADEGTLRAKVEELTASRQRLTETREQLVRSERLASVGRLAAGIAHEVGNPIAAMMGMEELLLEGDLPSETQRDFLQRMKRETDRIHRVVRDLLDFARPEHARVEAGASASANVAAVLGDVAALLRPQRAFRGVELLVEVEDPELRVRMSPDRLTQVVLNLAMNAGDALAGPATSSHPPSHPSGGLRIGAPRDDSPAGPAGRVTLRAVRRGDGPVDVVVEDTGPGIPEELRARVFEPFVTTKEVGQGTGLGLAVCRGLVEAAGGTITLDGTYTAGARFVVRLLV